MIVCMTQTDPTNPPQKEKKKRGRGLTKFRRRPVLCLRMTMRLQKLQSTKCKMDPSHLSPSLTEARHDREVDTWLTVIRLSSSVKRRLVCGGRIKRATLLLHTSVSVNTV